MFSSFHGLFLSREDKVPLRAINVQLCWKKPDQRKAPSTPGFYYLKFRNRQTKTTTTNKNEKLWC